MVADDEFCEDCGENADVYLEGVALCQSCANVVMDVEEQWEEQWEEQA